MQQNKVSVAGMILAKVREYGYRYSHIEYVVTSSFIWFYFILFIYFYILRITVIPTTKNTN